ncbi:arylsulfatase A-like [Antedon mediterranea]|uniref:arylsulfatase A-like n=1 Tax=Antedon mediterranea TaxID=105859 RepID=UPI003AF7BB17
MTGGLPHAEVTIPEMLAKQGYKSALVGKWHLGVGRNREFLPLHHGFSEYFGMPNSHVDCPCLTCFYPNDNCVNPDQCSMFNAPCQLLMGDEIIEQPVDMTLLAARQARAARSWIRKNSCSVTPFFLMYAFSHPHVPQFSGRQFRNSTKGGSYTDSLAELDWQVGEVMDELKRSGVIENTLVIFTSDNGADVDEMEEGGFSGVMRCGKRTTFEGGSRVPTIAYWKGQISSRISTELLSHLDIWPTFRSLSGSLAEEFDVTLDGFDFKDVLLKNGKSQRHSLLYYPGSPKPHIGAFAVRDIKYKAHFMSGFDGQCCISSPTPNETFSQHILFDILGDPEERNDLSTKSDLILDKMSILKKIESENVEFGKSVLEEADENFQLCCNPGCEPYPGCCKCVSNYTVEMFPINVNCDLLNLPFHQDQNDACQN